MSKKTNGNSGDDSRHPRQTLFRLCKVVLAAAVVGITVNAASYIKSGHHGYTLCIVPGISVVFVNPTIGDWQVIQTTAHEAAHVAGTVTGVHGCYEQLTSWVDWFPGYEADAPYQAEIEPYCMGAIVEIARRTHPAAAIHGAGADLWHAHGQPGMDSVTSAREFVSHCASRVEVLFKTIKGSEEWLEESSG